MDATHRGTGQGGRTPEFDATAERVRDICRARPTTLGGGTDLADVATLVLNTDGPTSVSDVVETTDLTAARARVLLRTARRIVREEFLADFARSRAVG